MSQTKVITETAPTAAAASPAVALGGQHEPESVTGETETRSSVDAAVAAPPRMVSVMRRKRRRVKVNQRTLRLRLVLLVFVVGLLILAVAGGDLRLQIGEALREVIPAFTRSAQTGLEVIVLAFAALIVLYLMPGVEDRVLKALGIKRSSSRRHRGSTRR